MAQEELEYFSPTVARAESRKETKASPARAAVRTAKASQRETTASSFRPFFQGITLGAVLMIPFGAWWWSQNPAMAAEDPAAASVSAKAKQAKPVTVKKKASRPGAVAAPFPVKKPAPKVEEVEGQQQAPPAAAGKADTAFATETPAAPSVEPIVLQPKKGVLRNLTAPFQKMRPTQTITGIDN